MLGELFYSLTTRPTRAGWLLFWLHVVLGIVFLIAQSQSGVTLQSPEFSLPQFTDSSVAFIAAILMLLCTLALLALFIFALIRNLPGSLAILIALFLAVQVYGVVVAMEVKRKIVMPIMGEISDMPTETPQPPKPPHSH